MEVLSLVLISLLSSVLGQEVETNDVKEGKAITWKVVGGRVAAPGQFPYIVSLRKNNQHFCGGAILNRNWVVTAAHCLISETTDGLGVVAGTTTLNSGGTHYPVEGFLLHPSYEAFNHRNDIALVKVLRPIAFSSTVTPIRVGQVGGGVEAVLAGWGSTSLGSAAPNFLQVLHVRTLDGCSRHLSYVDDRSQLCTFLADGQGACHGDSGGPLTANGYLVGVVSHGQPCATGQPDVFTRVSYYRNWIRGYTQ